MVRAFQEVRELRDRTEGCDDLRTASFMSAIDKIAICYRDMGIFP